MIIVKILTVKFLAKFKKQKWLPAVLRKKNMIELLTQLSSFYVNKIRAKIWDRKSRTGNFRKIFVFEGI